MAILLSFAFVSMSFNFIKVAAIAHDADCVSSCNYIVGYDPLCASDGINYESFGNECLMTAHNRCHNESK